MSRGRRIYFVPLSCSLFIVFSLVSSGKHDPHMNKQFSLKILKASSLHIMMCNLQNFCMNWFFGVLS